MGLSDSFYDEDSKCPKCQAKIQGDWQTKHLESLMQSWHTGDFFQYSKWEAIPEDERRRKYGNKPLTPFLRKTNDYFSKNPLILNGMVPVHTGCSSCNSWLEGYAKIVNGKFDRIVEAEATREEKQLVIIAITAKKLREEFEKKLSHLQESCDHKKSKWTGIARAPESRNQRALVCLRCEKILQAENSKLDPSAQAKRTSHD